MTPYKSLLRGVKYRIGSREIGAGNFEQLRLRADFLDSDRLTRLGRSPLAQAPRWRNGPDKAADAGGG